MSLRAGVPGPVDLLAIHRRDPATFPFLLQSTAAHDASGRYDLLFGFPGERITGRDGFAQLDAAVAASERAPAEDDLPFCGGWFLFLGYECAQFVEPRLALPASPFRLPDFLAVRCTAAMIHDRLRGTTTLVAEEDPAQLEYMRNVLQTTDKNMEVFGEMASGSARWPEGPPLAVEEDEPAAFVQGVERILGYLRAGDVFQVNLSRAWRATLGGPDPASALYARLRDTNPAPFSGLARIGGSSIVSSSPERLVRIDGTRVETRPIAGTRPRGSGDDDERLRRQLIGSFKERAEHVMLIDLGRNDLGRVCVPGSVEVSELMTLERYAHVHHIVSNVRGTLRPGTGPGAVLRAVFPGGTITGCPKVRAMEIIAELEGVGRGPYTGAMGYLSRCGRLDTSILIRTLVVEGDRVTFRAGAGIVADSDPWFELAETRAKARGLLLALGATT